MDAKKEFYLYKSILKALCFPSGWPRHSSIAPRRAAASVARRGIAPAGCQMTTRRYLLRAGAAGALAAICVLPAPPATRPLELNSSMN